MIITVIDEGALIFLLFSQDSDTGVVRAAASLLQENEGTPTKKQSDGTEVFDHSDIVRQLQKKQRLG